MDCNNNVENNVLYKIEQILKENDNKLPYIGDIMNLIETYYSYYEIFNTFYTDDVISYLEDTWDFADYISEIKEKAINDYIKINPEYTKEDLMDEIQNYNKVEFRNFLCDLTSNGYYVKTEKLLNDIKKMIGDE